MRALTRLNRALHTTLAWIAGATMVGMMLVTVVNMVLRRVYAKPFSGTYEVVGWLAGITAAFALGYTQVHRGHVAIDLVVARFSARVRALVTSAIALVSTGLFVAVSWRMFAYAARAAQVGSLSETMKVPFYPYAYMVALGCATLTLALAVDFIGAVRAASGRPRGDW